MSTRDSTHKNSNYISMSSVCVSTEGFRHNLYSKCHSVDVKGIIGKFDALNFIQCPSNKIIINTTIT